MQQHSHRYNTWGPSRWAELKRYFNPDLYPNIQRIMRQYVLELVQSGGVDEPVTIALGLPDESLDPERACRLMTPRFSCLEALEFYCQQVRFGGT